MLNKQHKIEALENDLRQAAPPLGTPDHECVARACARIASSRPPSPLMNPHTFAKPLLRVAACLVLLCGLALLMRTKPQNTATLAFPTVTFNELKTLTGTQNLESALACEAADIATDLADLTTILNDRTLSILF